MELMISTTWRMFGTIKDTIPNFQKRCVSNVFLVLFYNNSSTINLLFFSRDLRVPFTTIACPICTTVGVPNGMATIIMRTTVARQREAVTTVVADDQTMTLISKLRRGITERKN